MPRRCGPNQIEPLEARMLLSYVPPPSPRGCLNLDKSWRFHSGDVANAQSPGFDDTSWPLANLPHTWNAQDGQDGNNDYRRGIGWYRKKYKVSSAYAGRQFYLKFD